ncbi:hypothetical protein H4R34_000268 [Dimargaris verticillata]|uniref:H/ACA ribonucleoprotein complex subunit n=1 Tax=Dimargaris verticillata TaxID=2761393 RepID=A0A9W8BDK3_9FUNG|nr:hypothetical protein H4R34_000268 [Dimargaris verticillata]
MGQSASVVSTEPQASAATTSQTDETVPMAVESLEAIANLPPGSSDENENGDEDDGEASIKKGTHKTAANDDNALPRTENEMADPVIPEVAMAAVPEQAALNLLGSITAIVDTTVVITSDPSAAQAFAQTKTTLDFGTVLALADRTVVGGLFETFGPVVRPMFSVRFPQAADIATKGLTLGQRVYYASDLMQTVFVEPLIKEKGSDASNKFDEEVSLAEMDYSDDEQERLAKRSHAQQSQAKKQRKRPNNARRGGFPDRATQGQRPPPPDQAQAQPPASSVPASLNPFAGQSTAQIPTRPDSRVLSYDDLCFSDARPTPQ